MWSYVSYISRHSLTCGTVVGEVHGLYCMVIKPENVFVQKITLLTPVVDVAGRSSHRQRMWSQKLLHIYLEPDFGVLQTNRCSHVLRTAKA